MITSIEAAAWSRETRYSFRNEASVGDYVVIPSRLVPMFHTNLDACVYTVLLRHRNNETGVAFPSLKTIAVELGGGRVDVVSRSIKRLEAAGLIAVSRKPKTVSRYRFPMQNIAEGEQYAVIPNDDIPPLVETGRAKVYIAIRSFNSAEGCSPANREVAEVANLSKAAASLGVRRLLECGLIGLTEVGLTEVDLTEVDLTEVEQGFYESRMMVLQKPNDGFTKVESEFYKSRKELDHLTRPLTRPFNQTIELEAKSGISQARSKKLEEDMRGKNQEQEQASEPEFTLSSEPPTSAPPSGKRNKRSKPDFDFASAFESWWKTLKVKSGGKAPAKRAYAKAVKVIAKERELSLGEACEALARDYAGWDEWGAYLKGKGEQRFHKHVSTWLNGEGWNDTDDLEAKLLSRGETQGSSSKRTGAGSGRRNWDEVGPKTDDELMASYENSIRNAFEGQCWGRSNVSCLIYEWQIGTGRKWDGPKPNSEDRALVEKRQVERIAKLQGYLDRGFVVEVVDGEEIVVDGEGKVIDRSIVYNIEYNKGVLATVEYED